MDGINRSATEAKRPQVFDALEELNKAIETVRSTTGAIFEHLQLCQGPEGTEQNAPAIKGTLIDDRLKYLGNLRNNLYQTSVLLEQILTTVREI